MRVKTKLNNNILKTETYDVSGYKVKVRKIDNDKSITFKKTGDKVYQPNIIFSEGKGIIDCSGIVIAPENSEKIIQNIRQACNAIKIAENM